jgi:DNA-binding NarL/FixJ family response regulator
MPAGTRPGYEIGRDGTSGLTTREREVLGLLVQGLDQPGIGERLGITKQRVGQIVAALVKKGNVKRDGDTLTVVVRRNS